MKFGVPWRVKGIRPEARATAQEAARRAGVSFDDWVNSAILQQAALGGVQPFADEKSAIHDTDAMHPRLGRVAARSEWHRSGQTSAQARPRAREPLPPESPPPPPPLSPELERALREIASRQCELDRAAPSISPAGKQPEADSAHKEAPAPTQTFGVLEEQLHKIAAQIETLRMPAVETAIRTLREELAEIGRALDEAVPRRALEAIEKQIQSLNQRLAEGRQAGADAATLAKLERGLAEIRDALHALTPAENLVGYSEAIAGLTQKIDLIVAERDPATMHQLESTVAALRGMVSHVASNETVGRLAASVQALAHKIEQLGPSVPSADAISRVEQRIEALVKAVTANPGTGSEATTRLDALIDALAVKIERLQDAQGDVASLRRLQDLVAGIAQRLETSESHRDRLEGIERGMADVLALLREMGTSRAGHAGRETEAFRAELVRVHALLESIQQMLDRMAVRVDGIAGHIERTRGTPSEARTPAPAAAIADASPASPPPRARSFAATPSGVTPATPEPRSPPLGGPMPGGDAPGDQPLEPGSGPPPRSSGWAPRIAAPDVAPAGAPAPTMPTSGRAHFIAAARRAAQAAAQEASARRPGAPTPRDERSSLFRGGLAQRVKSLFIAASIIVIAAGAAWVGGTRFGVGTLMRIALDSARHAAEPTRNQSAIKLDPGANGEDPAPLSLPPAPSGKLSHKPLDLMPDSSLGLLSPPGTVADRVTAPPDAVASPGAATPAASPDDRDGAAAALPAEVTGTITQPAPDRPGAETTANPPALPSAIGSAALRNAAAAGDPAAAYEIGVRYAEGRGVQPDATQAARWFAIAASKGLALAQFRYASQLEKGLGVKKDLGAARKLYLAAAAQGNAKAMHNIAVLYAEGAEGKPDYQAAAKWFLEAARRGIADSQYNLGVLYARGIGVETNLVESYKWFALAAASGDREAGRKRDEVAAHMDAASLASARQAVQSFTVEPQPEAATSVPVPPGGWDKVAAPVKRAPRTAFTIGAQ